MRNKFGGDCYKCGLPVDAGVGVVDGIKGAWRILHKDEAACDIAIAGLIDEENQRLKSEVAQFGCVS